MKSTSIAFAIVIAALVAGCSENGGTPPGATQAGGEIVRKEGEPAAGIPADALFVASAETQDGLAAKASSGTCSIENVVVAPEGPAATSDKPNTYQVARNKLYRMVGFAVNKDKGTVPAEIEIVLTGNKSYVLKSKTGGDRADVATFFKNPAFAKSGLMQDASFQNVEPGDYAIYVISRDGDASAVCPTHQGMKVS